MSTNESIDLLIDDGMYTYAVYHNDVCLATENAPSAKVAEERVGARFNVGPINPLYAVLIHVG
jgi:hypothetical protein